LRFTAVYQRLLLACLLLASAASFCFAADGKTLFEQKRFHALYGVAQERLSRNPKDADALMWMGAVYDATGEFDKAVDYGRRATEAAPNNAEIHCQLADTLGDKALKLGVLGGGVTVARQMRHELYEESPAVIGGSHTKARETLQMIYAINQAEGALADAALLQMQKRPLPEIEAKLRQAVQLNPHLYRAVVDLTSILASESYQRWAETEHFARIGIAADAGRAGCHSYLAIALAHQQKWNELDAELATSAREIPDNLLPYYSAAQALLEMHVESARAERYLREYLAHEPEAGAPSKAIAHWKLGLVLEREGRMSDAVREVQAAAAGYIGDPAFKKDYKRIAG
jgi:tetratricopeptide (TPR) repeat protein